MPLVHRAAISAVVSFLELGAEAVELVASDTISGVREEAHKNVCLSSGYGTARRCSYARAYMMASSSRHMETFVGSVLPRPSE